LRKPYGPGWALVGDAGCRVDPITGQGITDAFRDVDLLADAICSGDFAAYQRARDEAVMPIYRYTSERARLEPPTPEAQRLFSAIAADQDLADQFAGVTGGTTNAAEFFAPANIARIVQGGAALAA
jgi:flavin-dependent dehydrogenase